MVTFNRICFIINLQMKIFEYKEFIKIMNYIFNYLENITRIENSQLDINFKIIDQVTQLTEYLFVLAFKV